jgi:hypothetical protein
MVQEKGGGLVLSSLANRMILPTGSALLANDYDIDGLDVPRSWGLDDFEALGQRAIEMDWLEKNLPDIKDRFLKVIRGQVSWEKMKAELVDAGFKGASDIKTGTVNALIAEQRHRAKSQQQDYRLTANTRKFGDETTKANALVDAIIEIDIASLRAKNAAFIEQKKQAADAGDAAQIAEWEAARKASDLEAATMLLQYGTAARSHPKFPGSRAMGSSSRHQAVFGTVAGDRPPQYRDQLKVEINGNVAGALNRVANRTGIGIKKIKNFFFGGS